MFFTNLPPDLLRNMCQFADPASQQSLRETCRELHSNPVILSEQLRSLLTFFKAHLQLQFDEAQEILLGSVANVLKPYCQFLLQHKKAILQAQQQKQALHASLVEIAQDIRNNQSQSSRFSQNLFFTQYAGASTAMLKKLRERQHKLQLAYDQASLKHNLLIADVKKILPQSLQADHPLVPSLTSLP